MQVLKSFRLANLATSNRQAIASLLTLQNKQFHLSQLNLASKEFEDAKLRLGTLTEDPGSDVKLKIYALFKQATIGKCTTSKPSMVDFVGRAKWNAWSELDMTQDQAEKAYIDLVNELAGNEPQVESNEPMGQFKHLATSVEYGNIYKIVLNRPKVLNAINIEMYNELIDALAEANANTNIGAICITGAGNYYSAGNDLTSFSSQEAMSDLKGAAVNGGILLEKFVNAFINLDKPLIGLINGPAVGIAVTLLPLFDLVLASDKATFVAPFTKIAQSPEACSSYTFPKAMGHLRANDILMFNRKLTAKEALEHNLLTEVIPEVEFQEKAWKKVEMVSKLPKESLSESRKVLRDGDKDTLRQINKKECDILVGRWSSNEFVRVIMEFWGSKQK